MSSLIPDNPYCKLCIGKYCRKREKKNFKDKNLEKEADATKYLAFKWNLNLKLTTYRYCPHDFYCLEFPMIGDITSPDFWWMDAINFSTPGWVIENFKQGTLLNALASGIMSFYVWNFRDCVKVLSMEDINKNIVDTTSDPLTKQQKIGSIIPSPHMSRYKGKYIHPERMKDADDYFPLIAEIIDRHKHNDMVDSIEEELEDY